MPARRAFVPVCACLSPVFGAVLGAAGAAVQPIGGEPRPGASLPQVCYPPHLHPSLQLLEKSHTQMAATLEAESLKKRPVASLAASAKRQGGGSGSKKGVGAFLDLRQTLLLQEQQKEEAERRATAEARRRQRQQQEEARRRQQHEQQQ